MRAYSGQPWPEPSVTAPLTWTSPPPCCAARAIPPAIARNPAAEAILIESLSETTRPFRFLPKFLSERYGRTGMANAFTRNTAICTFGMLVSGSSRAPRRSRP